MTGKNSRQARARAARAAAPAPQAQTASARPAQAALAQLLRQMAEEVAQLQTEIAAVEALIVVSEPDAPAGPSVGWQPSTQTQPWLVASSA